MIGVIEYWSVGKSGTQYSNIPSLKYVGLSRPAIQVVNPF
jgi:hypothetical protein